MKKIILLFIFALIFNSCKEEKEKETKKQQSEPIIQLDTTKTNSLDNNELSSEEIEKLKKEVNHLFVANGGSILYMKNGDVKGQARFDTDGDFVTELLKTKTYSKYKDFDNYVDDERGYKTDFFEENGRIEGDWVILKGIDIKSRMQVVSYSSPNEEVIDNIDNIDSTKLIIFSPETKKFKDENSVEAENYFIAMDDWNFYSHELNEYFKKLNINTYYTKKRYISFEIANDEKIILDSKSKINNYDAQALLYKKGKRPIIVYLLLNDEIKEEILNYLK